jgi:Mg-chelatase subunit ChlD
LKARRALSLLASAVVTAAALLSYAAQPRRAAAPVVVAIQDGKTIDFSDGTPAVTQSAADKAATDAAVREIDAASKDVSFPAEPPPKK